MSGLTAAQAATALAPRFNSVWAVVNHVRTISLTVLAHGGPSFLVSLGLDPVEIGTGYHHALVGIMHQAQAEGLVAAIEPNLLVMYFFAFMNGLSITYGAELTSLPDELLQETLLRLRGASAPGLALAQG